MTRVHEAVLTVVLASIPFAMVVILALGEMANR